MPTDAPVTWLPDKYDYRVVFMHRDLDEVMASQNAMLRRSGQAERIENTENMRQIYASHLEEVHRFLAHRRCFTTLIVNYQDVVEQPPLEARRLAEFVQQPLDISRMAAAVNPQLYRSRRDR